MFVSSTFAPRIPRVVLAWLVTQLEEKMDKLNEKLTLERYGSCVSCTVRGGMFFMRALNLLKFGAHMLSSNSRAPGTLCRWVSSACSSLFGRLGVTS